MISKFILPLGLLLFSFSIYAKKNNLHLIEQDSASGFAIYRVSKPKNVNHMKEFCNRGIQEIAVLSGNAQDYEFENQEGCPTLRVVYNEKQSSKVPVSSDFLDWFDRWVEDAKKTGKKIAFRCNCGCHRTGRLAAYYQMKFQKLSLADALIIMKKHGKYMFLFKHLNHQVQAMKDFIANKPCSTKRKHCVQETL